jgi:LEA14-like dessication related protein
MRLATLVLFGSTACAHIPLGVEKPTAEVEGVEVGSVSFTGIEGRVHLQIANPNGFGVPLESGTWSLSIAGSSAVSGRFDLAETIPAKASAPVVASLTINAASAARVGAALAAGRRDYTIDGTLRFSTRVGSIEVAFRHSGDLDDARRLTGR